MLFHCGCPTAEVPSKHVVYVQHLLFQLKHIFYHIRALFLSSLVSTLMYLSAFKLQVDFLIRSVMGYSTHRTLIETYQSFLALLVEARGVGPSA